jgi:hypothetical protein
MEESMTNRAFLIVNDDNALPNYEEEDDLEVVDYAADDYDKEAEERAVNQIVAASSIYIPVLWLSLFDIESIMEPYLRLEGIEIWGLGPNEYMKNLPSAIRWFRSGDHHDFNGLLKLVGARPSSTPNHMIPDDRQSGKVMLHGYEWVRRVPWKD